jgi:hypothetical protein
MRPIAFVFAIACTIANGGAFGATQPPSPRVNEASQEAAGVKPDDGTPSSTGPQYGGSVLCTAAVNSDGSRVGGLSLVSSTRLSTGEYEVIFFKACTNITTKNGWARWIQVDGLSTAVIHGVTCSLADRSGNANGIFVYCTDSSGALVDTSFYLFVAR